MSHNPIVYPKDGINLLTVARLSEEKGIDRVLLAVKHLIDKGYPIQYHIVGSGGQERYLKTKAEELSIGDCVFFYGNQRNPYPYMVNADLFVLASYHEAAPMVFDEAAFLHLPVLATQTTSTKEMIVDTGSGWVCDNSQEALTEALLEIVSHPQLLKDVKNHLQTCTYNNDKTVESFGKLLS